MEREGSDGEKNRDKCSPSFVPLCGLCVVCYYTLMWPENNRCLDGGEITLDPASMRGAFKLD